RELLPMARELELTVTPWAPIGGGLLTGKYNKKNFDPKVPKRLSPEGKRLSEKNLAIAEEVEMIANEIGRKPSQVALNWIRQREQQMIPIIGARTAIQLAEDLDCVNFELTTEQFGRLNKVSAIELGFPHDFLAQEFIKDLVYAGTQGQILRR
ncbi:MAG: aldo/keto reductase, partial [candidate division Zixibacteria bacterium]|nr:aldo/keto reductase [candidate division Zixibacteria bacterium]